MAKTEPPAPTPSATRCANPTCGHPEFAHTGWRDPLGQLHVECWTCNCKRFVPPASAPAATPEPERTEFVLICDHCGARREIDDGPRLGEIHTGCNVGAFRLHRRETGAWSFLNVLAQSLRPAAPTGEEAETLLRRALGNAMRLLERRSSNDVTLRDSVGTLASAIYADVEAALTAQATALAALREDAQRWRFVREHYTWLRRVDDDEVEQTYLEVRMPIAADLSCAPMADHAIDRLRAALAPRQTTTDRSDDS